MWRRSFDERTPTVTSNTSIERRTFISVVVVQAVKSVYFLYFICVSQGASHAHAHDSERTNEERPHDATPTSTKQLTRVESETREHLQATDTPAQSRTRTHEHTKPKYSIPSSSRATDLILSFISFRLLPGPSFLLPSSPPFTCTLRASSYVPCNKHSSWME